MNIMTINSKSTLLIVIVHISLLSFHQNDVLCGASSSSSSTKANGIDTTATTFLESDEYNQRSYVNSNIVPTIFSSTKDDRKYDQYAACLAATEGLRRIRDQEILSLRHHRHPTSTTTRNKNQKNDWNSIRSSKKEKRIQTQFIRNSKHILDYYGMSPQEFTSLSKMIIQNEALKQKVCRPMNSFLFSFDVVGF
jgi:Domain of unknown function (DUF4168)